MIDTFGVARSSTGGTPNRYRFGGAWGYMNGVSGLQQLGARYYWPEIGRFISQDPIGDGMNWYGYAEGNPVVWVDPTGLILRIVGDQRSVYAASRYLRQDPQMSSIIDQLKNSPDTYTIKTNNNMLDQYTASNRTIDWDPHAAWRPTCGGAQSPALGLAHELGHAAISDALFVLLTWVPMLFFDTLEEARVILLIEDVAALRLGESLRGGHGGSAYRVPTPTSR
ncbi:MAG: RHS repeat-associated core domain-containing protein [Armatimonadota bacterium]